MVTEVFNKFWSDLQGFYGKNDQRKDFKEKAEWAFQNVPTADAGDVYNYIVFNYEYFPKLPEFRNIAAKFEVVKSEHVENTERCLLCLNSGIIKYPKQVEGLSYKGDFFAACLCNVGRRKYFHNPLKGIEEVFPESLEMVKQELIKRNGGKHNISELKASFEKSMDIMNLRSQSFKREA